MLAEAAHSWADTGNELLLFIAGRRSVQPPDDQHPVGYGRDAYVWALFAGFGLFGVGSIVSIMHGIQELIHPEPATDYLDPHRARPGVRARGGLVPAGLAPGAGHGRDDRVRGAGPRPAHVRPDPACGVLRHASALVGLVIAFVGILLHQITGSATPDAVGSILVGIVLAVVAIMLIQKNRRFLVGVSVDPSIRAAALRTLLEHPQITSVSFLHIEYVGPSRVYYVAAVDLAGDEAEHTVARRLSDLADQLQAHPRVVRATLTLSKPGAAPLDARLDPARLRRAGDAGTPG